MARLLLGLALLYASISRTVALPGTSGKAYCNSFQGLDFHSLSSFTLVNATYTDEGSYNSSGVLNIFPFCRIFAKVAYGSANNNTVNFEIWLPESENYSGSFVAVGNGGMAGTIDRAAMLSRLNSGYAVAGGDSGHLAASNNNGNGAPGVYIPYLHDRDQVLAWIRNSIALFTVPSQKLVKRYYGKAAKHSFYVGCSTGGAQGFALAQYHPQLFDGIVAGCPGNWYSHLALSFLWNAAKTQTDETTLSPAQLVSIRDAAVEKCDELDGLIDGVIENPLKCQFDIETLACGSGSNATTCLSPAQIESAKAIYQGPRDARSGATVYPGFNYGSESEWEKQLGDLSNAFSVPILQNLVYKNISYDASTFNWGADVDDVDIYAGAFIDATDPDLSALRKHGGKMIVWQGWADPFNAATWPINHLAQIEERLGGDVSDFFSVFMAPGVGHCTGAASYPAVPGTLETLEALVAWVSTGEKPSEVKSSNPADGSDRTRKLCPWPKQAVLVGADSDKWTSFECRE